VGPHLKGAAAGSSFRYSFWLLPPDRRRALAAVYNFCRATDDIVDGEGSREEKTDALERWKSELRLAERGSSKHPVLVPLREASARYDIPFPHCFDLVRGVEMDLSATRYETFPELETYCELVASSVGLMCLGIFGRRNERTEEYARQLGRALQLTNIIRDVAADAALGRVYIPQEDLVRFGCAESDLLAGKRPPGFGELMSFQASRAEAYYAAAESTLRPDDRPAMAPARVMAGIYHETLRKIGRSGYDVFNGTVRLAAPVKFLIALRQGLTGALRFR